MADPRWQALVNRLERPFFYGVVTTGIFCRPGCGARRPNPENVRFFSTAAAAQRAGYRPCKRCNPGQPASLRGHRELVILVCQKLKEEQEGHSLQALADEVGLSASHLHRVFKSFVGITPNAYRLALRGNRLKEALASSRNVTQAVYRSGHRSTGRFYADAQVGLGMTPSAFRQGARGEEIAYAIAPCALGQVLVARTHLGICAVLLGDEPEALRVDLARRFPNAARSEAGAQLRGAVRDLVASIAEPTLARQLPLDLRGTAFQHRVWTAIRQISAGQTMTYSELAATIGAARSARAVARACAANPAAIVVPCHRVQRKDRALSGYRWGLERKQHLLALESKNRSGGSLGREVVEQEDTAEE